MHTTLANHVGEDCPSLESPACFSQLASHSTSIGHIRVDHLASGEVAHPEVGLAYACKPAWFYLTLDR
jgi:hypothetical protein